MHFLIYHSQPNTEFKESEVSEIGKRSQSYNTQFGITGLLLAKPNSFVQYLEGPTREVVNTVYDRIKNDPRHSIEMFFSGEMEERIFSQWSMGTWMMSEQEVEGMQAYSDLINGLSEKVWPEKQDPEYFLRLMRLILDKWIAKGSKATI